jgi:hypothetical protein
MSKTRADLFKEIEAKVARKKQVAQKLSRTKTVATWVAEFFTEYEKTKMIEDNYHSIRTLALNRLNIQLRDLDRKCSVDFRMNDDGVPTVEIAWSSQYIQDHDCEDVLVFDPSAAYFQSAMEDI